MKLALKREQSSGSVMSLVPLRIGSGVVFKLNASLELDEAEQKLLDKYNLSRVPLVTGDFIADLRKGFRQAIVLGILSFVAVWFLGAANLAVSVAMIVTMVMTVIYYRHEREQINVNDLLAFGRMFKCDSVVALIEKEAAITNMASYLRQVLESAKYWDDREVIDIEPLDRELLKQAILTTRT